MILLDMNNKGKRKSNLVGSSEGYDLYASQYENCYGLLRTFEKDQLFRIVGDIKSKKVLDLGCGTGRLIGELKLFGAEPTACDVSEEMLKKVSKRYPEIPTVCAEASDLPFEDGHFDFVIATFLVVHIKNLEKAFDEIYRVLKDGGVFVLTNINQRKAPKLKLKDGVEIVIESHYHRPQDVIKALESSRFQIEKEEFVYEGKIWINQIIRASI